MRVLGFRGVRGLRMLGLNNHLHVSTLILLFHLDVALIILRRPWRARASRTPSLRPCALQPCFGWVVLDIQRPILAVALLVAIGRMAEG